MTVMCHMNIYIYNDCHLSVQFIKMRCWSHIDTMQVAYCHDHVHPFTLQAVFYDDCIGSAKSEAMKSIQNHAKYQTLLCT